MEQRIYEGTPQELAPFLAKNPNRRYRLIELSDDERQLEPQASPPLDDKAKAAIALLDSWIAEGHRIDIPEVIDYEIRRELLRAG